MAHASDADMASLKKRTDDNASVSGSSTSNESSRERKRKRKAKKNGVKTDNTSESAVVNGHHRRSAFEQRRNSLGKAARDPRDEPPTKKRVTVAGKGRIVRSPSPVIDYDGLSRPSQCISCAFYPC